MSTKNAVGFPTSRQIRKAIRVAPPLPPGFPLDALRDTNVRQNLRAAPHLQRFLTDVRFEAARGQKTPLAPLSFSLFRLFETEGNRTAYEEIYFDRRRRLAGLVLATVLDDTDDYLNSIYDLLWEICNEYTWALPAHLPIGIKSVRENPVPPEQIVDLFSAHTAHMLAEIVSLFGERLPDWLHYRVRIEVERRVFQSAYQGAYRFWWETAPMNWASVCAGCAGMAAMLLMEDRQRLAAIIDRVISTMEHFLKGFGRDGGCPEGISYWVYGFGFFTYFAEMLSAFTGGQIDLLQTQRVRQIAAFPQAVSLGGGRYVNFSDAPERVVIHPGLGSRLAARLSLSIPDLNPPQFQADPVFRWGHITRDLLWTDVSMLEKPVAEGSFHLDDLAWVIDRHIWSGNTVAFAAKGGHNGEPHNHNDLGHFILHVGGESLLADLGAGTYTRQYFGEQRYEFLQTGSQGHSVPVINERTQRDGHKHRAVPLHYEKSDNALTFKLDLTRAYDDPTLKTFIRTFDWSVDPSHRTGLLRLSDAFQFRSSGGQIVECFISFIQPTIEANQIVWQGNRGRITMPFDPAVLNAEVKALDTNIHNGEQVIAYSLRLLVSTRRQSATITFAFELLLNN